MGHLRPRPSPSPAEKPVRGFLQSFSRFGASRSRSVTVQRAQPHRSPAVCAHPGWAWAPRGCSHCCGCFSLSINGQQKNNPRFRIRVLLPADVEQPDGYYARVSEEIGLIVQGSESQGSRARGCGEPSRPASADGVGECCPCNCFIAGMYRKHTCMRLVPMQSPHGTQTLLQS